jgi:hypothetical protein
MYLTCTIRFLLKKQIYYVNKQKRYRGLLVQRVYIWLPLIPDIVLVHTWLVIYKSINQYDWHIFDVETDFALKFWTIKFSSVMERLVISERYVTCMQTYFCRNSYTDTETHFELTNSNDRRRKTSNPCLMHFL